MLVIKEDTFTPWAEKKLNEVDALQYKLMEVLSKAFFENVDPFVPQWSGSLMRSAHHFTFVSGLDAMEIFIEWTGRYNPNDWEFYAFKNPNKEDYAQSVYLWEHYATHDEAKGGAWVEQGLETFDEDEVKDLLIKVFNEFLIK